MMSPSYLLRTTALSIAECFRCLGLQTLVLTVDSLIPGFFDPGWSLTDQQLNSLITYIDNPSDDHSTAQQRFSQPQPREPHH